MIRAQALRFTKPDIETHGKRLFWAWIAYQTIKGILTTSLIWVPLGFAVFGNS